MIISKSLIAFSFCALSFFSFAQTGSVAGKVQTEDGKPVAYATIVLLNTQWGAISNDNGYYNIQRIKPGSYTLQLSYADDIKKTETVMIADGSETQVDFTITISSKLLREVVVETHKIMSRAGATANKLPITDIETPQVVHSISNVILQKQNAMTLEDAMRNAPGVSKISNASSRPDGGSLFASRGFTVVTKVRNGLPNIVNTNVDMANLERIEIIKGPSATMFGSVISSYGGLINRVTKKPYFHNGGAVDFSYGSYNFYRASADANFVIKKDKMAARLNLAGQNQDSWQDAGFQKSYIIAASFLYKPNSRFTLNIDAEIVGTKGNSNGGSAVFVLAPQTINQAISGLLLQQGGSGRHCFRNYGQCPPNI